jgi:hypothetical protein
MGFGLPRNDFTFGIVNGISFAGANSPFLIAFISRTLCKSNSKSFFLISRLQFADQLRDLLRRQIALRK